MATCSTAATTGCSVLLGRQYPEYRAYHDNEWGRPVRDDTRLFEKICLEGFQSGLSWLTILRKRENFRAAFAAFEVDAVAGYGESDVERLLLNAGIVRHRGKIESTINNARRCVELLRLRREPDRTGVGLHGRPQHASTGHDQAVADRQPEDDQVCCPFQGAQTKRLELRRPHHDVRVHAVRRCGQRPPGRVPRPWR